MKLIQPAHRARGIQLPRTQIEGKVPFGALEQDPSDDWDAGIRDVTLGVKQNLFSSLGSGSIVSAGAEVKLPVGDKGTGLGKGTTVFEGYLAYGQIVAGDGFFQLQAIGEVPTDRDVAAREAKWRGAFGWTLTQGAFGRSWTPMVEVLGTAEFEDDATPVDWDLVPQIQVSLNTRQYVLANIGPQSSGDGRRPAVHPVDDLHPVGLVRRWLLRRMVEMKQTMAAMAIVGITLSLAGRGPPLPHREP